MTSIAKHFTIDETVSASCMAAADTYAARMSMMLQAQILDDGSNFEKACYAASAAYRTFRNVALGVVPVQSFIVIELGPQQRIAAFETMDSARAFAASLDWPHVGIDVEKIVRLAELTTRETHQHERSYACN